MRVFMTGATGFIGSWVAVELLEAGHEVVALVRNPDKFPALFERPGISALFGTLKDLQLIEKGMEGCEACVHVALGWGETASSMLHADTQCTVALLDAARGLGVSRFIYTSSTAVYGPFSACMNEDTACSPDGFYGATKLASEAYTLATGAQGHMRCNVIRPGYTFGNPVAPGGPTQPDERFRQIARAAREACPQSFQKGDGTQFIAAADLARLYRALLESDLNREVFLGLARPFVTWQSIAQRARDLSERESKISSEGEEGAPSFFDLSKMKKFFGFDFSSDKELEQHILWCLENS